MKQKDFHIYLTEQERTQVIGALIQLKNSLIAQGRYTDAVDDILIKVTPCCALHLNKIGQAACFSYLRSRRLFCVLKKFLKKFQNRVPKRCLSVGTSEGVKKPLLNGVSPFAAF